MSEILDSTVHCPNCGAIVPSGSNCPACGAPLVLPAQEWILSTEQTMTEFIDEHNEDLVRAGSSAAEAAFGLGCSLGGIFSMVVLLVVFLLGTRNWILIGIAAMGLALVSVGVAAWLSNRAKEATQAATYQREIEPEILRYTHLKGINRLEFDARAHEMLSDHAPLRRYLLHLNGLEPTSPQE